MNAVEPKQIRGLNELGVELCIAASRVARSLQRVACRLRLAAWSLWRVACSLQPGSLQVAASALLVGLYSITLGVLQLTAGGSAPNFVAAFSVIGNFVLCFGLNRLLSAVDVTLGRAVMFPFLQGAACYTFTSCKLRVKLQVTKYKSSYTLHATRYK